MPRERTTGPIMEAPLHDGRTGQAVVMTESAISTITLPEGSFACFVQSTPGCPFAAISILDRDEVEAHIQLLRNAMEDAERLDQGLPTIHAAESLRRS